MPGPQDQPTGRGSRTRENCEPLPIQNAWPQRHWPRSRVVCSCRRLQDETPLAIALDAALGHLGTFASGPLAGPFSEVGRGSNVAFCFSRVTPVNFDL